MLLTNTSFSVGRVERKRKNLSVAEYQSTFNSKLLNKLEHAFKSPFASELYIAYQFGQAWSSAESLHLPSNVSQRL
jgi:hypothetical protein